MTHFQIEKMKVTETLVLTKGQLFWHYAVVPFLLIIPIITIVDVFKYYMLHTYTGMRPIQDIRAGYIWLIPAGLFFYIQKRRLKFKVIQVAISSNLFKQVAEQTAKKLKWTFEHETADFIVAHRDWSWTGSWGEMITIIRDKDRILINSICDPDKVASVVSYGMNKQNVRTFEEILEQHCT